MIRNKPIYLWVLLVITSLLGVFIVLITTRWGVGLSPDSVAYIGAARNLISGYGFSSANPDGGFSTITHYAPFYSVLLSWLGKGGLDPMVGARWVNAVLFGLTILMIGLVLLASSRNYPYALPILLAGSLIALVSPVLLEIYSMAWSEAIFLFLSLSGFILLGLFLDHGRIQVLIFSAILIGLALLTRYAGLALILSGVLGILLFGSKAYLKRIRDILVFSIISLGPMAFWALGNRSATGEINSREFAVHLISIERLRQGLTTVSSWLLIPEHFSGWIKVAALFFLVGLVGYILRMIIGTDRAAKSHTTIPAIPIIIKLILLFLPVYLIFLALSISFFDANTPLDGRILSPIFAFSLIVIMYMAGNMLTIYPEKTVNMVAIYGVCFILIVGYSFQSAKFLHTGYREGIGFNSVSWHNSEILKEISNHYTGGPIYSNLPEAIYVHSGMPAFSLPKKFESANQRPNQNYQIQLASLIKQLSRTKGILVYFDKFNRPNLPTDQELMDMFPLKIIQQFDDGTIYGIENTQ